MKTSMVLFVCLLIGLTAALSMKATHEFAPPPFAVGSTITPTTGTSPVDITIKYKYGSFFGSGGDQSVDFSVVTFKTPAGDVIL